jgi:hypothetical protein
MHHILARSSINNNCNFISSTILNRDIALHSQKYLIASQVNHGHSTIRFKVVTILSDIMLDIVCLITASQRTKRKTNHAHQAQTNYDLLKNRFHNTYLFLFYLYNIIQLKACDFWYKKKKDLKDLDLFLY